MLLTTQQALASQYPTVQSPASQPGLPGLQGFFNNPLLGLAAGLLQGASPGGTFAGGLNLGLVNAQNMARQQAATALLGQQLKDAQYLRVIREQQMGALNRLGEQYPAYGDFWKAGVDIPQSEKPVQDPDKIRVYEALLARGYTKPEAEKLAFPSGVTVNTGGGGGFTTATPEQAAQISSGQPLINTKTGQPFLPPSLPADQRLSAGFAGRMINAEATIGSVPYDMTQSSNRIQEKLPRELQSSEFQQVNQAQDDWILANVRKESGATIPPEEMLNYRKTYFPQPGDSANTQLQKKAARIKATESMLKNSGSAFTDKVAVPQVYHGKEEPQNAKPGDLWQDANGDWYEFK